MTTDRQPDDDRKEGPESRLSDRAVVVLLVEVAAVAIAFVSPVTPTKTGSTWSPAELVTLDPSYLQEVASSFVAVNALVVVVGLVLWATMRFGGSE